MKRPASSTIRTRSDVRVFVTAAAVIATLSFLCVPTAKPVLAQESTRQMPAGMEVGEDGVSIDGEAVAGDGCAKVGAREAGDCGKGEAGGKGADRAGEDAGEDAGRASDEQYGAKSGSEGGAGEATVLESTTSGAGGPGSGGGKSTRSQTIESTTGVVEEGSDDGAEVDAGGGENGPKGAEQGASEAANTDRGCAAEGPTGKTTTTTVERIIDGDTVKTPKGTVRMIGVDTPETVDRGEPPEPGGEQASGFTASELEGEEVELEPGTGPEDDHGRALAYVWTEDGSGEPVLFNEVLLREGLAELLIIPPNDEYERCLAAAEKAAQDAGASMRTDDAGDEHLPPADSPPEPETPAAEEPDSPSVAATTDGPTQDHFDVGAAQPEPAEPGRAAPVAAENQYEEVASEPTPAIPTDEPEIQEPEIQEPEIQEPEIREEAREPRVRRSELTAAPAEIPVEDPAELPDGTNVPPPSVPAAPVGAAPITTLPETGGASVVSLAAGTVLVCSGLLAARLARTPRAPGNATAHERDRN